MKCTTFFQQLDRHRSSLSRAIVIPGGPNLSYLEFIPVVRTLAANIASLGLSRGSVVSIALPNGIEFATVFLAVTSLGLVAAPLNPAYKRQEFAFYLEDTRSQLLIVPSTDGASKTQNSIEPARLAARELKVAIIEAGWQNDLKAVALSLIDRSSTVHVPQIGSGSIPQPPLPEETAYILHTSGTTGRPKAVPLTHGNMAATVQNIINTYHLTSHDASYLVMPLFHVHGLMCGLFASLGSGGGVIIPPKFSATHFWDDFVKYHATWYTAVPTIHQIILKQPLPIPLPKGLRFVRSCSSPLAPATFKALEKLLNVPVIEAYAMTEACHQMTSNMLPPGQRKPGTVGIGQGVEVAILDDKDEKVPHGLEGEISVKGPNVTPGYINNEKANAESFTKNGYFRTGDQGKFDKDGLLVITGRIKELINRGGEKISPIELDSVMMEHPAVSEAVSFAAPDSHYGQVVNAAVVPRSGAKLSEKDIQDFVASRLADFKVPQRVFFTEVMPKTATGKIQRRMIADKFLQLKSKL